MLILILMVFVFVMWFVSCRIRRRKFVRLINQFDGPPTRFFFGNSLMFPKTATEIYKMFLSLNKEFPGQPYRIWLFHKAYVVIHNLKDARIISKLLQKDDTYSFISDILGEGLITSSGAKWKKTRTIMDPHFNSKVLNESFLSVFNIQNDILLHMLKIESKKGTYFDIKPHIYRTSLFSLYENIMGFNEHEMNDQFEQFIENKDKCAELCIKRIFTPWLHPRLCFTAYLFVTGQSNIFDKCRNFFIKVIGKKKQQREFSVGNNGESIEGRKGIIDILMNRHCFNDTELTDEILTLLFAGTETTVSTVCFTILMLAKQPEIQKIVHEEIRNVFGDSTRLPDTTDLSRLIFLEQCIKETLRVFTIIPSILRKSTSDVKTADGKVIPAGATVYLSIHELHHNPDIYPKPDIWNPHNFDPEKVEGRPVNSFVPFGLGPRMCLGYKYAMMSVKTTLTMMIRNFELSTNQTNLSLEFAIVLKTQEGYFLKLKERDR